MEKLLLQVTTRSPLFIGGTPASFEIGGVDLFTVTDDQKKPYIPASSLKGVLRSIVRDFGSEGDPDAGRIAQRYYDYLNKRCAQIVQNEKVEPERIEGMKKRFDRCLKETSAEFLFGIAGFNDTPKLIFQDLTMGDIPEGDPGPLIDDYKNTVRCSPEAGRLSALPRSYRVVRPGVSFYGEIWLYRMEQLETPGIADFVERAVLSFNEGIYRLGNSGSRGYGRIEVAVKRG